MSLIETLRKQIEEEEVNSSEDEEVFVLQEALKDAKHKRELARLDRRDREAANAQRREDEMRLDNLRREVAKKRFNKERTKTFKVEEAILLEELESLDEDKVKRERIPIRMSDYRSKDFKDGPDEDEDKGEEVVDGKTPPPKPSTSRTVRKISKAP